MPRVYEASEPRRGLKRVLARHKPALQACVDSPADLDVVTHNGRVCRFSGWAISRRGREISIRVEAPAGRFEVAPDIPRSDVNAALGIPESRPCGYQFYVDLPPAAEDGALGTVTLEFTDGAATARSDRFRVLSQNDPEKIDTYLGDGFAKRALARRRLRGRGLEVGALHQPLQVDRRLCEMSYADRWTREQAVARFPELEAFFDQMVEPDLIVDVATDELTQIAAGEFDFLVANDVIEHLPNPIRFLRDLAAAMKPGAALFLAVPDRDFTFDVGRAVTPAEHLWEEFDRDVTEVDDDHIADFLANTERESLPEDPVRRRELFELHRQRSIHVHVWDQGAFDALLEDVIGRLELGLAITDRIRSREADGSMVYVLEKR